jgi:hypothetical protein
MKVKIGTLYLNTDQITFAIGRIEGIEVYFHGQRSTYVKKDDPNYQRLLDILASDFVDLGMPE